MCNYCGNQSGKVDTYGNCISCGAPTFAIQPKITCKNYRVLTISEALQRNTGGAAGSRFICDAIQHGWRIIEKPNGNIVWVDPIHSPEYY